LFLKKKTPGGGLAVTEEEIFKATLELSKNGFFVEPTCASAAVGLEKLRAKNLIHSDETTVVVLTGSGLKSSDFFTENVELQ
jgi:threonine synthase